MGWTKNAATTVTAHAARNKDGFTTEIAPANTDHSKENTNVDGDGDGLFVFLSLVLYSFFYNLPCT